LRVLVTGGAGFLGSNAIDALVARGDVAISLDDLSTGQRANLAPDIPLRQADVSDRNALFQAVHGEGFDAIVHCAAKTKVVESMEKVDLYRRVIVEGTRNVVALAEDRHVQMLVNISTGGALYGETPVCATEHTPTEPPSNYGKFKLEAEGLVAEAEVPSITLRLANIYGPRQRTDLEGGVVAIFSALWKSGKPLTVFGDGKDERDYVYVGDAVDAIVSSFAGNWTGTFNIGTGVPTSVSTLIAELAKVLGPAPEIRHAPERAGGVELDRSCLDCSKAARTGLWRPTTTLVEGLRRTAALA
jgi:UDP-glucose 4-epimerase